MGTYCFNRATPLSQEHIYSGPQKTENGDSMVQLATKSLYYLLFICHLYYTYRWPMRLEMSKKEIRVSETCQMQKTCAMVTYLKNIFGHYCICKDISSEAVPTTCPPTEHTVPPF